MQYIRVQSIHYMNTKGNEMVVHRRDGPIRGCIEDAKNTCGAKKWCEVGQTTNAKKRPGFLICSVDLEPRKITEKQSGMK